ncbi:MAG: oligosaccharide flippase family protein [Desulfovibrionaceae bacterium]|nr:oligosaccharide flippase family protein [Desulfovibrionaceae bacterium]
MPTPPLAQRYLFKLLANIAAVPVYLVMEALLPRALGPAMYGNFSFATNLFQQFFGFLDMGTSTCFYNALSRRQQESGLISYYFKLTLLIFVCASLIALLMLYEPVGALFMPYVPLWLAPLAALWAFLTWFGRVLRSMNDALGLTVSSEIIRTLISLLALCVLVMLFLAEELNIVTLFAQQYLMLIATAIAFWWVTSRAMKEAKTPFSLKQSAAERKSYHLEFFNYSHPLFVQALLSFLMLATERWLLQWFNGSAEQGFFALSQKVSLACFLFVSAMTPLVMRELSIAWGQNDKKAMGQLITRFAPLLYVVAAYFSCFTLVEGQALVNLFGGEEFQAAIIPVQIMALYPLHQAYGQLAGSVFHASGKTHILRNMTAIECVYGFILTWLLLAPNEFFGFNLGATGLAIKTVVVQFITVNAYLCLASRFIPLNFLKNLIHQILSLLFLLALAYAAKEFTLFFDLGSQISLLRFLASGLLYSIVVALACLIIPQLLGLDRQQLKELIRRFNPLKRLQNTNT